jgi:hypothetical protein
LRSSGCCSWVSDFSATPAIYERSLGINVNMKCGRVLLAFGAGMLWLAWRGGAARKH